MSMFKTEKEFVKAFQQKLGKGFGYVKIESHSTGNGIPDLFVQGSAEDFWIEFKNESKATGNKVKVPWRPGQQAWAIEYYRRHNEIKWTLTLMSGKDGVYFIPMTHVYNDNVVENLDIFYLSADEWHALTSKQLFLLLLLCTNHTELKGITYRGLIVNFIDEYYPYDLDYDPEVIFPTEFGVSIDDYWENHEQSLWHKIRWEVIRNLAPLEASYYEQKKKSKMNTRIN